MKKIYKRNWLFKLKSLAVFGSMLFAGSAMAQLSGTYTINSASTTSGSNYASFSALATDLNTNGVSGSVTVNVVPNSGPYDEDFYLEELTGSSAANTITINGNGETLSNDGTVIELEGTDHITFNNLVIEDDGTSSATKIVFCWDEVEYITFDGCEVVSSKSETYTNYPAYYTGSYMWFGNANFYYQDPTDKTSNITITDCKLWKGTTTPGNKGKNFGIIMSNPSSFTGDQNIDISNNEICDFGWRGLSLTNVSGIDVSGNDMHNMYNTDPIYSYGIYLDQYFYAGTKSVNISENYLHDMTGGRTTQGERGIYLYMYYSSSDVDIVNNIITTADNSYQYGIQFGYSYNYSGDCNVIGNTIRMNSDGSSNRHYGIYLYYVSGANVKNNILSEQSQNFNGNSWLIHEGYGANNMNYDNNVYDYSSATGNAVGSKIHVGRSGNTDNETTFEDWIGYTSEANSVWADPIFKDPSTGDYSPRSIAMANKGAVSAYTTDYNGVTRGTTPDIGALEYFVDVEIVSVNMSGTLTECAPYTESVSISVKNNSAFDVIDIPLKYSINGGTEVKEVSGTSIPAGTTATFVFDKAVVLNGSNTHVITAAVDGDDDAPANSSAMHTIGTTVSPTGGDLTMGSVFKGYFNNGAIGSEDNAVFGFENEYNIVDPATATNYTTTMMATTDGGTDVTSSGFSLTNGTKTLVANPAVSLAGENIYMEINVLDNGTGCDTAFGRWMYVPHTPVPSFDASNICLGDVAQFKNTSTLGGPDYIITHWEFNDPEASVTDDFSDIKDGFWEYTTYGSNVDVTMTVTNGVYPKFEYSLTQTIDVTPKPIVDFKVLNACEGSPITVTDNTRLPVGITGTIVYDWDFAGDYSDNTATPSYTFTTPGQRKITLTASSNGCNASLTKNAYQFEMPVAAFTSLGDCNFVDVEFMNSSTIENGANMGFAWDFGTGVSREENPKYAFATPGAKNVTLTATSEFGCANSTSGSVTLKESPEADFTIDAACNLTPINFTRTGSVPNGGTNCSYSWDFNGEDVSAQETPTYLFSKVGTKMVTLSIDDLNGCSSSITKEVNVVLQAVADFEAGSVCQGDEAVFTNKSTVAAGDLTYIWNFGDATTSTDLSGKHLYTAAKVYNVTLEAIVADGCSDQITKQIIVNPSPVATFNSATTGRDVAFTADEAGNDLYRWTFGQGGSSDEANPTYTYDNVDNGTFTVCLATKKGECWSEECNEVSLDIAGISELTENNAMINVYPNPTTGKFNVTVENAGDVVVKVGDILGNVLDVNVIDNLNGTYKVDMSAVADGVYFVQVKNGDLYATKRVTVSK